MDFRDASIEETRPLNPDSVQPPLDQESLRSLSIVAEERREIRLRLISVLRFLTVDLTFANIVVQLCANPTGSTQVFSVVWDFFIIIWFLLFTLIYKARNTLPPIHLFVGDWSFKYSGPEREHDVGDAIRAVASNKPSRLAVALQHLIDVSLAVVLLSCSIVNAIDMNIGNRLWYHNDPRLRAAVSISVLHFFVFALMLIILVFRLIEARTGTFISLNLALNRNNEHYKYSIRLPEDGPIQKRKTSTAVYA